MCCASMELKDLNFPLEFFFIEILLFSLSFDKRTLSTLSMADYALHLV